MGEKPLTTWPPEQQWVKTWNYVENFFLSESSCLSRSAWKDFPGRFFNTHEKASHPKAVHVSSKDLWVSISSILWLEKAVTTDWIENSNEIKHSASWFRKAAFYLYSGKRAENLISITFSGRECREWLMQEFRVRKFWYSPLNCPRGFLCNLISFSRTKPTMGYVFSRWLKFFDKSFFDRQKSENHPDIGWKAELNQFYDRFSLKTYLPCSIFETCWVLYPPLRGFSTLQSSAGTSKLKIRRKNICQNIFVSTES